MKKNKFGILFLCVFGGMLLLHSCQKDEMSINGEDNDRVYSTFYEDIPLGFDSVQIVSPNNSILKNLTFPKNNIVETTPEAGIFYIGLEKVIVLSYGDKIAARLIREDNSVSDELLVQTTLTRSINDISYIFSVGKNILFEINQNINTKTTTRVGRQKNEKYLNCVDRVSDEMANGSCGVEAKLLCKLCSGCAVAAAAAICIL